MSKNLFCVTTLTPDKDFHLILDENDIALASGFGSVTDLTKRLPSEYQNKPLVVKSRHPYKKLVKAYYAGDKKALSKMPYRTYGTIFQKQLWQTLAKVPYGKTLSYQELAIKAGMPKAIRAVGTACGANRLILLIPCHRILKSNGQIGNYLYGNDLKVSLLQHEASLKNS